MSKLFTLGVQDFIKGLVMAVTTAVLTLLLQLLQSRNPIDWKEVALVGVISAIGYILKNLATDENGKLAGRI